MLFSLLILGHYSGDLSLHFGPVLANILGFEALHLGPLYLAYLVLLSTFCVNSINIYAGVSGLESGQALIIGLSLAVENLFCMAYRDDFTDNLLR